MSDSFERIILALITAAVPLSATALAWLQQSRKIRDVHDVVNSKHSEALSKINDLEGEIRRLKADPTATTPGHLSATSAVSIEENTGIVSTEKK